MTAQIYDNRICALGEGPIWHPLRSQLFWFDILGKRLMSQMDGKPLKWQFDDYVSAAGWLDQQHFMIATATNLIRFNIETGATDPIVALEANNPVTRSNDGRADAFGGFWIGTMGINAEREAGAIYRYYKGEIRQLFPKITIPNAISFSPDGRTAYFTDTPKQIIWRQSLDGKTGWPVGDPVQHIDLRPENLNPDGAVVDAAGHLWNAQWGASRVARYDANGVFDRAFDIPASQASCPAFGGADQKHLFVTSASVGLTPNECAGLTYKIETGFMGQTEHQVLL